MALTGAVIAGVIVSACADGVELNGKIFDALGVSSTAMDKKTGTPKVAERNGLVLPPDLARLPEPGSGGKTEQQQALDPSFPVDAEERKRMAQADLERQQAEYCKKHYETKKALAMQTYADAARGPLGSCSTNPILKGINVVPGSQ